MDSGSAPAVDIPSRGDRPNRKFGPDAKPFRARSHKVFQPEGGKQSLKEKVGGPLYRVDDGDDYARAGVGITGRAAGERTVETAQTALHEAVNVQGKLLAWLSVL